MWLLPFVRMCIYKIMSRAYIEKRKTFFKKFSKSVLKLLTAIKIFVIIV